MVRVQFGVGSLARPTLVEVWAPNCHSCRAMQTDLAIAAERYADSVDLIIVNVAEDYETASTLAARATPTLIGVRDGEERFRFIGRRIPGELDHLFAALATGGMPDEEAVGLQDALIRLGAGALVAVGGVMADMSWPLVLVGLMLAMWGGFGWLRTMR